MRRMPGWIARDDRTSVSLSGTAMLPDGRGIPVHVTDISEQGCQVSSDETLRIGDSIKLNTEKFGEVTATVRWSLFGTAGLRFVGGQWK
jgi:hypothetical protein